LISNSQDWDLDPRALKNYLDLIHEIPKSTCPTEIYFSPSAFEELKKHPNVISKACESTPIKIYIDSTLPLHVKGVYFKPCDPDHVLIELS
jgi:hypothetical protein